MPDTDADIAKTSLTKIKQLHLELEKAWRENCDLKAENERLQRIVDKYTEVHGQAEDHVEFIHEKKAE